MRKRDKLKNMTQANLMLERSYISLKENFNPKKITWYDVPEDADMYCGTCYSKFNGKPELGSFCPNCQKKGYKPMEIGLKVDVMPENNPYNLPSGFYLWSPKYDNLVANQLPPQNCPPDTYWDKKKGKCTPNRIVGPDYKPKNEKVAFGFQGPNQCPPNTKWSEELQRCTKIKGTEDIGKNVKQIVREICKKVNNPAILKAYKTITKNKNLDAYFERLKSVCTREDVSEVKREVRNFLQQVYYESPVSVGQQFQGETGRFDSLLRQLINFKGPNDNVAKIQFEPYLN